MVNRKPTSNSDDMHNKSDTVKKQTWAKRFVSSLASEAGGNDWRLREIVERCDAPRSEDDDLFHVGWNTLAHTYANKALSHLENLIVAAESPIEKAMLIALCVAAHDVASNIRYKKGGHIFGDLEDMPDVLTVEPQAQLGEYRVDFLLTYQEYIPDFDRKEILKDGTEIPGVKQVTVHLIVECDGHEFHDRSKEQASRDRERDRELKKLGYEVFRYTGSDIWKSPFACAREAVEVLTESAWK